MKYSIVIPNYNGESLLQNNIPKLTHVLQSFVTEHKETVEVVIIDDASEDNSKEIIKHLIERHASKYIHIKTASHSKNKGFSSTVNTGVKLATGEIVILCNTDIWPEKGFLDKVAKYFNDKNVFAVGFMDKSIEGDQVVLRGRGVGKWQRGFLMHSAGSVDKRTTLWASGGSSAFRKSLWDTFGGFVTLYDPFYWEDIDLSYRALKAGYTVLFASDIVVTHEHEKGAIRTHYTQLAYRTIAYRNALYFVWLNITDARLLISHILWLPYHFIKTSMKDGPAFTKAFIAAVLHIPHILTLRRKATQTSVRRDWDVLREYHS